ncbi:hypothetical protein ERX46_11000 [Brumimicrobium glaciale]|uniref:Uncharacterized protein n=1 Tax=Brumimicrobium glaciale TaxID=200475 RepID=A0A4Q4KKP7_9FLAO|nr:oligosaccharide flippase family protein [Brumimicrobium glaciale]RYM33460.1 hypothetical protein ERX46_11000 [Brumimicrobium glaciale]
MLKSIFKTGLSKVLSLLIALIIGIVISRVYGTEGKGLITLLILIPTMISLYAGFSLGEGFLYFIGNSKVSKNNFDKLLIKITVLFSILLIITFFASYYLLVNYEYYIFPQILLMISLFLGNILKFSLKAVLNFKRFNLIQILDPIIILIGLIIILILKTDLKLLLWGYLLSNIIQNIILYYSVKNKLITSTTDTKVNQIFKYSYKVHFFGIMNFTEAKFDVLLIGYIINISAVGIYSVAISITLIFQTVIQTSISTVLYPMLVKSLPDKRIKITKEYFKISSTLSIFFLITIILFGKYIITILYGDAFAEAYIPMLILIIGAIAKSPTACINSYFKAIGKPSELYKTSIVSLSTNIILCIITIPTMGIIGAAISSSVSYFLYGIIMLNKFKRDTKTTYIEMIVLNKKDIRNLVLLVKKINPRNG